MLIHGHTLWLLLLLHVSRVDSTPRWNLFRKEAAVLPQEGAVRLAGSQSVSEGRVEIYHSGTWGTVCDDGWDLAEAQVVCRQLNFPGAKAAVNGGTYGEGSGQIWLDDMRCKGTENFLTSCSFKGWAVTDCTHKEDVGVICEADMNVTIDDTKHSLDHSQGLSEELGQLFDSGDGCDFQILQVDHGSSEMVGTTICAHKMILSRFPRFNASQGISSISVHVSQSCQPHFTSFIRYLYTRKMDVVFSSAMCIHQMASEFGVEQLMADTGRLFTKILPEDVSFHTQVSLYDYAVDTGDMLLQENCVQYMAWNYQNLTESPAWGCLSVGLLGVLLSRSDLVVPDESFLLRSLESWISEKGNSTSLKTQADLLSHIRFPMIPAEKLYELQFNSTLYHAHESVFRDNMLKAYQFNVVLFSTLSNSSTFNRDEDDYQPRIYTAEPWDAAIDNMKTTEGERKVGNQRLNSNSRRNPYQQYPRYYYPTPSPYVQSKSFTTPVHNSMIFKDNMIRWDANVFQSQQECSNRGVRCESLPAARLISQGSLGKYQSMVRFSNRLLLTCQGKYICQVQDFKNSLAHISSNSSLSYPCANDQYIYHFVVRPDYI